MSKWITVGESRRKRISMTHSQPQPEQTVAKIVTDAIIKWQHGVISGKYNTNDSMPSDCTDQIKAALNRQALATALRIVGDDETDEDEVANDFFYATRNGLRVQLRQAFTDYYGGGEV